MRVPYVFEGRMRLQLRLDILPSRVHLESLGVAQQTCELVSGLSLLGFLPGSPLLCLAHQFLIEQLPAKAQDGN